MKRKQLSLLALLISILAIILMAWLEVGILHKDDGQTSLKPVASLSDVKVPSKAVLEQMDQLERIMHLLSAPPPQIRRQADLSGLGYVPLAAGLNGQMDGGTAATPASTYRLTLAFDGEAKRYCMIDDQLYAEGAALPDGATIVKIESRRVLIAKESLRQWLDIMPLLETAAPEES